MNPRSLAPLAALLAFLPAAQAVEPAALAALEELGRINGVALACRQPALGSRARNAVTTGAPKTRDYGEIFEKATQDAYLAQGQRGSCPDGKTLSQALDQAEAALNAAFPRQP